MFWCIVFDLKVRWLYADGLLFLNKLNKHHYFRMKNYIYICK